MGFALFLRDSLGPKETLAWTAAFGGAAVANLGGVAALTGLLTCAFIILPWPSLPPLVGLGTISYSLYLIHVPIGGWIVNLAARLPDQAVTLPLGTAVAVLGSLAGAYILWRFVGRRSLEASKRIVQRPIRTVTADVHFV